MNNNTFDRLRQRTFALFEDNMSTSLAARAVNFVLATLIILNVVAVIVESDAVYGQTYEAYFRLFEAFSVTIFSIEFLIRLWICVEKNTKSQSRFKTRLSYLMSPVALIDLMAIVPFYLSLFVAIDLRYLRLFRVMRILKLTHYFKGFNIFITVITKELRSITAALLVMVFLITIAASVMYTLENQAQPDVFGSIPQALWWSVVTMTTVGYGDVTPITTAGKIVAMFVMLMGVGLVALPAGMLAGRFSDELKQRRRNLDSQIDKILNDGYIDSDEYESLRKLAEKLELQPEDIAQSISIHQNKSSMPTATCPHCHKPLHQEVRK